MPFGLNIGDLGRSGCLEAAPRGELVAEYQQCVDPAWMMPEKIKEDIDNIFLRPSLQRAI